VDATLDTLSTALYVKIDDLLKGAPHLAPWRPAVGITPKLTDAELVTLAVLQALLGFCSEARWLRYAHAHLGQLFPYLPQQSGYNKRLRAAANLLRQVIGVLAADTSWWTDEVWVADSTQVECGRSKEWSSVRPWPAGPPTATAPATRATSGGCGCTWSAPCTACRSASRWPAPSRRTPSAAGHPWRRPGQTLIADKHYYGRQFEAALVNCGVRLLRPARKGEPQRPGAHLFRPLRQVIESINQTFKGQLDLERHGGHTPAGVVVRVLQRILALPAVIWHNDHTGQPTARSLLAYGH
jgi:hypothetical protein